MTRTVVITGASDGIGAAAARRLAAQGARVVVVGRSPEKTRAVADGIGAEHFVADFAELDQVRVLADRLLDACPRIDVLADNAGGVFRHRELTVDGHEKTFQVNHLAPFLLTGLLRERLLADRASVITTSSLAHFQAPRMDLTDLDLRSGYHSFLAYGAAKLANVLFTRELDRRFGGAGLAAAAFHPGVVASNFGSRSSWPVRLLYRSPLNRFMLDADQGADTLVWLATGTPGREWESGGYYAKRAIAATSRQAGDAELAAGLWAASADMVGLAG